jgi:hypothetical protein
MTDETLIDDVLRTVEREIGPVTLAARIAIERALYEVIDQAELNRIDPTWPMERRRP